MTVKRGKFDDETETPTEQEYDFAKECGGRRVPRSGAHRPSGIFDQGSGYKGDVELEDFIFELKQTKNNSISIKVDWLNRMVKGAIPKSKRPGVQVQFNSPQRDRMTEKNWVLIEQSAFKELLNGQAKDETGD